MQSQITINTHLKIAPSLDERIQRVGRFYCVNFDLLENFYCEVCPEMHKVTKMAKIRQNCKIRQADLLWRIWLKFFKIVNLPSWFRFDEFSPLTPKIWLLILPSSCYTFPCKLVTRIFCSIRDNMLYLISLSILTTCLLDNVWIQQGEVTC